MAKVDRTLPTAYTVRDLLVFVQLVYAQGDLPAADATVMQRVVAAWRTTPATRLTQAQLRGRALAVATPQMEITPSEAVALYDKLLAKYGVEAGEGEKGPPGLAELATALYEERLGLLQQQIEETQQEFLGQVKEYEAAVAGGAEAA